LSRPGATFRVGGSKVRGSSDHDEVTLSGAGVTLHDCLHAAGALATEGIAARVIDCYSIKPIDTAALTAAAQATSGRIVIAEDHHPEGGLGSAVTDALLAAGQQDLSIAHLAVREMPGSRGSPPRAGRARPPPRSPRPPARRRHPGTGRGDNPPAAPRRWRACPPLPAWTARCAAPPACTELMGGISAVLSLRWQLAP